MKTIIKAGIVLMLIFSTPFILPVILKILINNKIFENVEEYNNIANSFYNFYPIIYICIIILVLLWFFYKWDSIKEMIKNFDYSFNLNDKSIQAKKHAEDEIKEENQKREIIGNIKSENESSDSKDSIKEARILILKNKEDETSEQQSEVKQLKNENKNIRYYAAYNVINSATKSMLHKLYNEKFIETKEFKNFIISKYKKRNKKNIKFSHKDLNEIAESKYQTMYEALKFLNIIEPSEDDNVIRLTAEGKEFVKEYIEKDEVIQND